MSRVNFFVMALTAPPYTRLTDFTCIFFTEYNMGGNFNLSIFIFNLTFDFKYFLRNVNVGLQLYVKISNDTL